MSIREVQPAEPVSSSLALHVVSVVEPGVGVHVVYEVRCALCGGCDQYDQRSAAITYGAQHQCDRPIEFVAVGAEAGRDASTVAPAALIVSGGAPSVPPPVVSHPSGRPAGQRSLRNDIARAMLEEVPALHDRDGYVTRIVMRGALERAQLAVECVANWVLVFGPQALIDEVSR